jgi:signal-transduction protein with cAMP-binding, CBS, and nucleotidyltransferase domain
MKPSMKTAEELIKKHDRKLVTISTEATLFQAIEQMIHHQIGSILIENEGEIVGIWTERDFLRNSMKEELNLKNAFIRNYMHKKLIFANHDDTIYQLMDKFLGLRIRQILIKKEDQIIGLLSSGDVIKENLVEKAKELKDMKQILNWEYYENWNW